MDRKNNTTMRFQTMFVWIAFMLMASASVAVTGVIQRGNLERQARETLAATQETIEAILHETETTLLITANVIEAMLARGERDEVVQAYLDSSYLELRGAGRQNAAFAGVYGVFTVFGGKTLSQTNKTFADDFDHNTCLWYNAAIHAEGAISVTRPYLDAQAGERVITYSILMMDREGNNLGVLAVDIYTREIEEMVISIGASNDGFGMMLDEDFTTFIHPSAPFLGRPYYETNEEFAGLMADFHQDMSVEERRLTNYKSERTVAFSQKMNNGWYLFFMTPRNKYYGSIVYMAAMLTLLGVVFATVLTYILQRLNAANRRHSQLLDAVNQSAGILLSVKDETTFIPALMESMALMGGCVDADRVQIWRNETIDGVEHFTHTYEWLSEFGQSRVAVPKGLSLPYAAVPAWEALFKRGDILNCPLTALPRDTYGFMYDFDIVSIAIIPLFVQQTFWGLLSLDDCRRARAFTKDETKLLESAGLMMVSALEHNELLSKINANTEQIAAQAHWYGALLDGLPFAVAAQDMDMKWVFVNGLYADIMGKPREALIGLPCCTAGTPICNTDNCAIKCARQGKMQVMSQHGGRSHQIDTQIITDRDGREIGYIEVVQDITDKETLIKRQVEADSANKAKSKFLAAISHEIRTPMNAILGVTEMQLRKETLPPETRDAYEIIYNSGNILLSIVNDVLDLSKTEAGKMEVITARYDVAQLVGNAAQLNSPRIGGKPILFELRVDPTVPAELTGDSLRIGQVLNNILSNAMKYTNKGRVTLTVETDSFAKTRPGWVMMVFEVADTGVGMTEEQVKYLFHDYTRFNEKDDRATQGTGLGMGITKNLLDLMGGEVSVKSQPGRGTLFTVRLPQETTDGGAIGQEMADALARLEFRSAREKTAQPTHTPIAHGRVLVVDDSETNLYVVKGLLAAYKLTTDTVLSGPEAIEKIKGGAVYDIIFMDHMMPHMDGLQATEILRGLGYTRPIVALTANAMADGDALFLRHGFDDYLYKPIDTRRLDALLKKLIGKGEA